MNRLALALAILVPATAFGQSTAGQTDTQKTPPPAAAPTAAAPPTTTAPASATASPAATAPPSATGPAAPATASAPVRTPPAAEPNPNSIAPGVTLAAKALAVKPGHYRLDPAHGKITWSVNHLGFSTYMGQFSGVSADLDLDPKDVRKISLVATVDLSSVGTLNPKLDAALAGDGFFNAKAFPKATFKSTKITINGAQTARIDGDLTLKGHTFPIVISATFNNAGVDPVDKQYTVGFDGASIIRRSTFGVSQYVPFVGDLVTLRIEGEFKPVGKE